MSQQSNYKLKYQRFIESRRHRPLIREKGYEIHHILPTSIGGTNDKSNKVKLTCREHFVAHRMLAKMFRGEKKYKMMNALWFMSHTRGIKITSRLYQTIKEQLIDTSHKFFSTPERREQNSKRMIGNLFAKTHGKYVGGYKSTNDPNIYKNVWTPERRKAWSERMRSKANPMLGKKHSEETKRKISKVKKRHRASV